MREEHWAVWEALVALEWAAVDDSVITIQGDGAFYLPLIQDALAHDRLEAMRRGRAPAAAATPRADAGAMVGGTKSSTTARMPAARAS